MRETDGVNQNKHKQFGDMIQNEFSKREYCLDTIDLNVNGKVFRDEISDQYLNKYCKMVSIHENLSSDTLKFIKIIQF